MLKETYHKIEGAHKATQTAREPTRKPAQGRRVGLFQGCHDPIESMQASAQELPRPIARRRGWRMCCESSEKDRHAAQSV